jgi:hypothetical protein
MATEMTKTESSGDAAAFEGSASKSGSASPLAERRPHTDSGDSEFDSESEVPPLLLNTSNSHNDCIQPSCPNYSELAWFTCSAECE